MKNSKSTVYLVTGAAGHLGSTIIKALVEQKQIVRGLVLPGEKMPDTEYVTYYEGDVCRAATLSAFFDGLKEAQSICIHTAGLIDISRTITPRLYDTNVGGVKNIIGLCKEFQIDKLLYVSSVHAIPAGRKQETIAEVSAFSPDKVRGAYAKTKAEATGLVLEAAKEGLYTIVVHPSGIIGPYDDGHNHLVQVVKDYMSGKLPATIRAGYDMVDVRDVAEGCLLAAQKGAKGSCYILSNRYCEVKELLDTVREIYGGRKLPVFPLWVARALLPVLALVAKIRKCRPLYTRYSLFALESHDSFSYQKASEELGYHPREFSETIKDTVEWLSRELETKK